MVLGMFRHAVQALVRRGARTPAPVPWGTWRRTLSQTVLPATTDKFRGVTVAPEHLPTDAGQFRDQLRESLRQWRELKYRAAWLEIPAARGDLVPLAIAEGYRVHHASDRTQSITLLNWLPPDEKESLPPYASHTVGVGAFVQDDRGRILMVKERFGIGNWKIPGGYLDDGEDVSAAIVREVKEETGVATDFHSVICFRQAHTRMWNTSDLYLVCRLVPRSAEIRFCHEELSDCRWVTAHEFREQLDATPFARTIVHTCLSTDYFVGMVPRPVPSAFGTRDTLYAFERKAMQECKRRIRTRPTLPHFSDNNSSSTQ